MLKFLTIKKKALNGALVIMLSLICLIMCVASSGAHAVYFGRTVKKVPIYKVDTKKPQVALTFDAAWGADKTRSIVDILTENGCKATFFLVAFWVDKFPSEVQYIDDAGFEIGTHSTTHPKMSGLSESQIRLELTTSSQKIEDITKKKVTLFRPPFGDYNDLLLDVASGLKLKTIQWSIDSLDWKDLTADQIVTRVMKNISGGDIVLFHNNSKNILGAIPIIINRLKQQGYELVTLSEMLYHDNYIIDNQGVQKCKEED